jgi:hypothetical protein
MKNIDIMNCIVTTHFPLHPTTTIVDFLNNLFISIDPLFVIGDDEDFMMIFLYYAVELMSRRVDKFTEFGRWFPVCLSLSMKMLMDDPICNLSFASAFGCDLRRWNEKERLFCISIKYRLHVNIEDLNRRRKDYILSS